MKNACCLAVSLAGLVLGYAGARTDPDHREREERPGGRCVAGSETLRRKVPQARAAAPNVALGASAKSRAVTYRRSPGRHRQHVKATATRDGVATDLPYQNWWRMTGEDEVEQATTRRAEQQDFIRVAVGIRRAALQFTIELVDEQKAAVASSGAGETNFEVGLSRRSRTPTSEGQIR